MNSAAGYTRHLFVCSLADSTLRDDVLRYERWRVYSCAAPALPQLPGGSFTRCVSLANFISQPLHQTYGHCVHTGVSDGAVLSEPSLWYATHRQRKNDAHFSCALVAMPQLPARTVAPQALL
jgi:hypothetical protein